MLFVTVQIDKKKNDQKSSKLVHLTEHFQAQVLRHQAYTTGCQVQNNLTTPTQYIKPSTETSLYFRCVTLMFRYANILVLKHIYII